MRFATPLIAIGIAFWGTTIRAQAIGIPHPSVPAGQPSFHIQSFGSRPMSGLLLRPVQGPSLSVASGSLFEPVMLSAKVYTCPMPVAHTDSAKEDPMPVARGGTPVPMPVAKAGCSNPLRHVR